MICTDAVGNGRWWVMEQQPGPVNWAPHNPAPLPGMVRLWTWEAFAHGAEAVSYFRWRQAPFASGADACRAVAPRQQTGTGPGGSAAGGAQSWPMHPMCQPSGTADVALVFDYDAEWAWQVQPHGRGLSYFDLVFAHYRALRRAGLSVDVIAPDPAALAGYRAILAPGLMHLRGDLARALMSSGAEILLGPRTGARDGDFRIPLPLPPALPDWDLTVSRVESLRPDMPEPLRGGGAVTGYREHWSAPTEVVHRLG
jgi:beta-galactosidase